MLLQGPEKRGHIPEEGTHFPVSLPLLFTSMCSLKESGLFDIFLFHIYLFSPFSKCVKGCLWKAGVGTEDNEIPLGDMPAR